MSQKAKRGVAFLMFVFQHEAVVVVAVAVKMRHNTRIPSHGHTNPHYCTVVDVDEGTVYHWST